MNLNHINRALPVLVIEHGIPLHVALDMNKCELAELHGLPRAPIWCAPYDFDACGDPECMICGIIACRFSEPLHFHHDGCPAAYPDSEEDCGPHFPRPFPCPFEGCGRCPPG